MDYAKVALLLQNPAAKLLRADQAAFVLSFLHASFKESGQISVPEESLQGRLQRWLEEQRREDGFPWERGAREYLEDWCSEDKAWIRKVQSNGLDPAFELTASGEKALAWVESLQGQAFVGTESRLETIFQELDDLLLQASSDPDTRIEALRVEREKIDAEIARLMTGGIPQTYEAWQINERYARLLEESRTLVSDFRQVEENFRRIAQEIVERRTSADSNKGEIVERVLDSHEDLRQSPQGRSFYGFVHLLLDPDRRDNFEAQVHAARHLDGLADELKRDSLLKDLLRRLRVEKEKVGESTKRLTSNLRRALETAHLSERRRVRELVSEIQSLALKVKDSPPSDPDFFEIDETPEIWSGLSRPLWDPATAFKGDDGLISDDGEIDWDAFARLRALPHLSLQELRDNVDGCLADNDHVLLSQVVARYPVTQGVLELAGYIILASKSPHYCAKDQVDTVDGGTGGRWVVPRVMFCRETVGGEE